MCFTTEGRTKGEYHMTKFGAVVRRIFLAIFMALFLVACVTKAESNTSFGSILYMGMLISGGIYFLFSVVSISIRVIRRKKWKDMIL